mgnify:CR=1 FL=1
MRVPPRALILALISLSILLFTGCSDEPDGALTGPQTRLASLGAKAIPSGYYDTVDVTNAATLRATLHAVIDDHTRIPYTSSATDTWNVLEQADQDPNDSGRVLDVYMNESYVKHGAGNTDYNREHSWPKSYGFPSDGSSNYPYTDCHHLFISNDSRNSSRGNTSTSVFTHGSSYDVSGYTDLEVEFWYKPRSMENNEDFWVQYWDGSSWQTVASFASGSEFSNNQFYNEVVQIPAGTYTYPTDAKIRFRCDASGNSDYIYVDEVEFRGFN